MAQNYHKRHSRRDEFIELGKKATFYGTPVEEMDRSDLLMMIGYLSEEKEKERTFQKRKNELFGRLGTVQRRRKASKAR